MTKIRAAITGINCWVPDDLLTNQELETMVDTSDEWITTRTGIKERRILKGKGLGTSDMASEAVKGLLEKTNTSPDEIELLICATVTPDMQFPAAANIISDKAGIKNAYSYDINAACSSLIYSLTTASKFIETGINKKIVIVGADKVPVELRVPVTATPGAVTATTVVPLLCTLTLPEVSEVNCKPVVVSALILLAII